MRAKRRGHEQQLGGGTRAQNEAPNSGTAVDCLGVGPGRRLGLPNPSAQIVFLQSRCETSKNIPQHVGKQA